MIITIWVLQCVVVKVQIKLQNQYIQLQCLICRTTDKYVIMYNYIILCSLCNIYITYPCTIFCAQSIDTCCLFHSDKILVGSYIHTSNSPNFFYQVEQKILLNSFFQIFALLLQYFICQNTWNWPSKLIYLYCHVKNS